MWILVTRCHEQSEFVCIVDVCVTKFDLFDSGHLKDLLQKNWVKQRIQILTNTFQKDSKTQSKSLFKSLNEVLLIGGLQDDKSLS